MSRLIDADKLKKAIHEAYSDDLEILEIIDEQPTVYDVDKVVTRLDKTSDYYEFNEQGMEHVQMLRLVDAIEIVKGGGVE